jgi:hypothetical protein
MAAPKKGSQNELLYKQYVAELIEQLKGEPATDSDGHVIMVDGKPLMLKPKAAVLKEIREFLADNGIDEEPTEGSEIHKVSQAARKYQDDPDPFQLDSK